MSRIFLLRHGETEGNRNKIYRGRWDLPLNANGRMQALAAAGVLTPIHFSKIYVSPLRRARETAEAVARVHREVPIQPEEALLDIDYGEWSRRPDDEIAAEFPEMHRRWTAAPETVTFPGGEGLSTVRERIEGFLEVLPKNHPDRDENILLVSHRVPLKVLLCVVLGLDNSSFWKIKLDTASICLVMLEGRAMGLEFCNDTCHLKPLDGKVALVDF